MNQKAGVDHARVIADCFKHSTVLPFRFGTVFQDDESLRKSIRSNQRQFQNNLERLHGKTEMHLKIHVDDCCRELDKHLPLEGVGKEYLSNLREARPASANVRPAPAPSASRCTACSLLWMRK